MDCSSCRRPAECLKPVLLSFPDHQRDLLEGAEYDHAWRVLLSLAGILFQKPIAEMEKLRDVEGIVRMKRRLVRLVALTVSVVPVHIPVGTAGIEIVADVIRDIRYDQLRPWDGVRLEILKMIVIKLTFHHLSPYLSKTSAKISEL